MRFVANVTMYTLATVVDVIPTRRVDSIDRSSETRKEVKNETKRTRAKAQGKTYQGAAR